MRLIRSFLILFFAAGFLFAAAAARPAASIEFFDPAISQDPTPIPLGPSIETVHEGLPCDPSAVHGLYFYSTDCPHCMAVLEELMRPMENEFGTKLDIRLVEIDYAENYELLIRTEERFGVQAEDRAIPTLIIDSEVYIGETAIRDNLRQVVEDGIKNGGIGWPDIPDFDSGLIISEENAGMGVEICSIDSAEVCETGAPIYAAYLFQTGCDSCSRVEADLAYLRGKYPQMIVEKFNVYDQAGLGIWLAERVGRSDFNTPAVFIGSQAWIGEKEITPAAIEKALQCLQQEGSPKFWDSYNPEQGSKNLVDRFRSMSWLTVVLAGLVDGLNPCAFATLIFFVSYLTLSGRTGREVIFVGLSFTLGVFLAYLAVGLGFYKVLDLLGGWLDTIAKIVYGITAALCLVLAVFSFLDFFKARQGKLDDLTLKLPENLRKRINKVIREGRGARAYVIGAFVTGLIISMLELACTGQVYLPTIIFVSSMPELQLRAVLYLVLYNLLFILPLVVVFILAYFGTTSKDLTKFLQKNAAAVKIGMSLVFLALGIWLIFSILA